jgi:hypothetical protein
MAWTSDITVPTVVAAVVALVVSHLIWTVSNFLFHSTTKGIVAQRRFILTCRPVHTGPRPQSKMIKAHQSPRPPPTFSSRQSPRPLLDRSSQSSPANGSSSWIYRDGAPAQSTACTRSSARSYSWHQTRSRSAVSKLSRLSMGWAPPAKSHRLTTISVGWACFRCRTRSSIARDRREYA